MDKIRYVRYKNLLSVCLMKIGAGKARLYLLALRYLCNSFPQLLYDLEEIRPAHDSVEHL